MTRPAAAAKSELRREMRQALKALTDEQIAEWSRRIVGHLALLPELSAAGANVSIFGGLRGEPDLQPLIAWLGGQSGTAALFAIEGDALAAREVRSESDWICGRFGVWEPRPDARQIRAEELSVILVPGLAFGKADGSRLGRGAGYYDRLLSDPRVKAKRIGVCFAIQVRDSIPAEPHDERMDVVVTERGASRWPVHRG